MINAENVVKSYGDIEALKGVNIKVAQGTVFGLIGVNGAGKSTFVKSLLGLINIDSGSIQVNGIDSSSIKSREHIAYLPEKFNFFDYFSVQGVLNFFAKMHNVDKESRDQQIVEALEMVGINDLSKRKLKKLSKGQLQRVGIAATLIGDKDLIILDEPFSGLDPIGVKNLKDLVLKLKAKGKTIFINSHILSEIEKMCDQLAIIDKGECVAIGKIPELLEGKTLEDFFVSKVSN